ncbi:hypothetical protein CDAR_372891 [Caerostris darwini]|uniref:Uncharacterized protein n=1 Tax=Caerostris darwini TaxID=1538125 RepID=A0AAV4RVY2_9ARAC|nr:hypothetical protein CDAR_372781 [Caerostris darwini]GIY24440.1 hypothetical protein CDAR_372891 [Caerostris darwini]
MKFYLMVADRIVKSFGILQEPDGFVAGGMVNCAAFNRKFQQMRLDAFRACAKNGHLKSKCPVKKMFCLLVCSKELSGGISSSERHSRPSWQASRTSTGGVTGGRRGSPNIRGRPAASLICKRYQTTSALRNLFMSFTSPPDPDLGFPDCSGDRFCRDKDSFQDRALCVAAGCHGN